MARQSSSQDSGTLDACGRPSRYRASDAVRLEVSVLAAASDGVDPAPANSPSATEGQTRYTILVVDDEPDMRVYMKACLRLLNGSVGRVLEAADGEAALEEARRSIPHLVISDVRMPKMNGYTLCRALRADPALQHIPVLLVSAATPTNAIQEQARKAGAVGFLSKPFNARRLCAELERLLHSSPG